MLSSALVAIGATASSKRVDLERFAASGMELAIPVELAVPGTVFVVTAEQIVALLKNCSTDANKPPVIELNGTRIALVCSPMLAGRAI
jgi:Ni,Fe-hydrogenase III small subunit